MRFCKYLFIVGLLFSSLVRAQKVDSLPSEIFFEVTEYDFGEIMEGSKAEFGFRYKNIGVSPLVLTNVSSPCGCTIPDWTKKPLKAGKKSEILVKYNSKSLGSFNKTVTVYSNAKNSPVKLTIKGVVLQNLKPKKGNFSRS